MTHSDDNGPGRAAAARADARRHRARLARTTRSAAVASRRRRSWRPSCAACRATTSSATSRSAVKVDNDVRQAAGLPVRRVRAARRAGARRDRAEGPREERLRAWPAATCPARRASSSACRSPGPPAHIDELLRDMQTGAVRPGEEVPRRRHRRRRTRYDEFKKMIEEPRLRLGPLGRHARDRGQDPGGDEGDDPLHPVRRPEGSGQVHGDRQAVGAAGGVRKAY